jgi:hypothetical protein
MIHYTFAHEVLRKIAFKLNTQLFEQFKPEKRESFFRLLFKREYYGLAEHEPAEIVPEDIGCHELVIRDRPCVVLEMPVPESPTEAWFIGLVSKLHSNELVERLNRLKAGSPVDWQPDEVLEYLTLERSGASSDADDTTLCAWTAEGRHCWICKGPKPTLENFTALIEERLKA